MATPYASCLRGKLILDGEVIALRADGTPHPFQITMRRFGRKRDIVSLRESLPLNAFFFDCLHVDAEDLIAEDKGPEDADDRHGPRDLHAARVLMSRAMRARLSLRFRPPIC